MCRTRQSLTAADMRKENGKRTETLLKCGGGLLEWRPLHSTCGFGPRIWIKTHEVTRPAHKVGRGEH